ncbi:MAG: hypothetical protein AVDCRST_MAG18-4338 [uncultured Thermomicrobiales bacterium]|uniref:Uncharacterized protein n=1 Tax=uncultured Thermomicrobiales bacterium TaxID=1645740 RepID=A0A6J4VT30_9BACT|nr:MAG: hypothetical protein AVDCRST_MAG18-4338 [uncultured Thermomicrobiales bacterium]
MDLTRLIIPILFGLALPFINRRVASRVGFGRYLLRLVLLPGAFAVGLGVLDLATGGTTLWTIGPSIAAFIVAGLIGYGLARATERSGARRS